MSNSRNIKKKTTTHPSTNAGHPNASSEVGHPGNCEVYCHPKIGRQIIEQENLRMWFVKGFKKHLIFHKIVNKEMLIIRVLDSAKDYQDLLR